MKKSKVICLVASAVYAITVITGSFAISANADLDVIRKGAVRSFEETLEILADRVEKDERNTGWSLRAPDDSIRFIWSGYWESDSMYDAMFEFDAAPFIEAGLDPEKLPEEYLFDNNRLIVGTKFGASDQKYEESYTSLAAFEQIADLNRDRIGYHEQLDHFGVDLGYGNMFEWANEMSRNDKDIVFVLNPEGFVQAGVDPEKIDGWIFAEVEVMDHAGKMVRVEKLLKPFDVR